MKKLYKLSVVASLGLMAVSISNTGIVNASSAAENSTELFENNKYSLNTHQINKIDRYVIVKNNQYVLSNTANDKFSQKELIAATKVISQSNNEIEQNGFEINDKTKTYSSIPSRQSDLNIFGVSLRRKSGYTYKNFWWGTRYYFRSNAAVYKMDHELDNYALLLGTAGALAGIASAGWASAVGAVGAGYFQKMKSDLDYMNNTHPHNYLYMDVNRTGIYKIKVLK